MKNRLKNFWYNFKQDPFGYFLMLVIIALCTVVIIFIILAIYGACTGQIKDTGGESHGISWFPLPNGNGINLVPIPY